MMQAIVDLRLEKLKISLPQNLIDCDARGKIMPEKPTYEDLEKRIQELEKAEHEREQIALALQRRLEFEKLVKEISSEFAGVGGGNSIDLAINRALSSVGTFTGADRAYIFSFKNVAGRADNTHEWCAKDIKPQIDNLKDIPIDEELPWFTKHMRNHEVFHVPKMAALPHEAVLERKHFEAQNIQSLIVVPMETTERLIGFLGFDAVTKPRTWGEDDKAILQFFAQTLSHVIERKMVEDALRESEAFLQALLDAIPAPVFYKDRNGRYLGFNRAFETFFGEKRELIIGKSVFEINPLELAEIYHAKDEELFNSGGVQRYESQWKNAHGELRDFIFNKAVFTDSKGTVNGLIGTLTDITERNRAEAALRESEEKFRLISEQSLMAIVIVQDERIKYANQAYMEMTGYTWEEIMNWTMRDVVQTIHPDDIPFVMEQGRKKATGISDGVVSRYAYRGFTKSGEVRWIDQYSKTITYMEKPANLLTFIDINYQKLAQETLIQSEKRYRDLADSLPQIVFETDENGKLTFVNRNAFDIFGYSQHDFDRGINSIEMLIPEDRNRAMEKIQKVMRGETSDSNEYTALRKDGGTFPILINSNALIRENKLMGIRGIIVDLTQSKKVEEALRESEEKFRAVVEKSPLGIALIGRNGHYKYTNPQFSDLFGYTIEDIQTGTAWFNKSFPDKDYRKEVIETWIEDQQNASVGQARPRIFAVTCKDGSRKEILFRPVTLENLDQFVIYEDLTEKRKMEHLFQQAQKMEAIGTLAGGIAHDFNNLLMAIQGRTSIMLMDKDYSHPDFGHLKGIESYIGSAADLTKQLLGFARGGKYEVKPTDLNELIKKESRMFGRTKKEITILEKYEENLWSVEVDRGQIQQVLLNLYVNAWQAMPGGGDLYLETENITLDESYVKPFSIEPGRYVKISVTDTGIGMDKATQEKIFDPFFTTKEMGRGTGLGLASAYGIIKNHGGFINAYSEKGHGSTFNIYLPASEKKVIEERKLTGDTLGGFETVLFVDDEEMITEVGKDLLDRLGYRVLIAESGKEAIKIYEENKDRIDIVVLDMIMPDMSGGETYDRLKDIHPKVKVLLSSGYSINGQATEILDRGCNGFIQKPFRIKELSQKLREVLDEK